MIKIRKYVQDYCHQQGELGGAAQSKAAHEVKEKLEKTYVDLMAAMKAASKVLLTHHDDPL